MGAEQHPKGGPGIQQIFCLNFSLEIATIPTKERLALHLNSTISNPRQRAWDGKGGNKSSGPYHRLVFVQLPHLDS